MQNTILMAAFFLFSFMFTLKSEAADFEQIYVFGDSYSDDENFYNITKSELGIGIPPPPYKDGRFSNGPVWVEYLAQDMGLNPSGITNLAVGGAKSGLYNVTIPPVPGLYLTGVLSQIKKFTAVNKSVNPNALYIVWGGTNDFLYSQSAVNPSQPVTNISTAVRALANVGAKNILVSNLFNLGDLPGTRNSSTSTQLNDSASEYNVELIKSLNSLSQELNNVNIIFLDVNYLFKQLLANSRQYEFTNVLDSCIGSSVLITIPASTPSFECKANPDRFLFWDSIHPTTAGHKIIAEYAASVLKSQPILKSFKKLGKSRK
ncbi:SGNH/GDSL hydrolase family protein [Nostoc edaphicum CCNP1411]|uniref:SGNH/GDSL hydrolase family protein n=1 Tax=Nostoc edaphicum CCNP1411 TaxID=1472755 RepID=A0A7D7QI70_9NOSO|nr:SGNH/GDSL hydrolase family protein [Nostoc edaphicum]QMS87124.1 SGNH/GDSL hydrolase family protein [Nostoc edaphicum CCNP1411]